MAANKHERRTYGTLNDDANFSIREAYKAVRTNLLFALPKRDGCRKFLISSALPGEGKTTTSVNTAITMAQTGAKVLIIDCDLRKPRVHAKLGLSNSIGLTNALSGMVTIDEAIAETGRENLWAITAGTIPPNPAELLGSDDMINLIAQLETMYDFIIMDTAPINIVSDALVLTKLVDGVVLIVKQGFSTHPSIKDALSKLEFAGANVTGIIMNGVTQSENRYYKKGSYRYRYKYYSYAYEDSEGKKKKRIKNKQAED